MENEQRTDHDILICIEEKIRELRNQFDNHLKHHFAITLVAISAGLIGMVNFGIAMIILFFKVR